MIGEWTPVFTAFILAILWVVRWFNSYAYKDGVTPISTSVIRATEVEVAKTGRTNKRKYIFVPDAPLAGTHPTLEELVTHGLQFELHTAAVHQPVIISLVPGVAIVVVAFAIDCASKMIVASSSIGDSVLGRLLPSVAIHGLLAWLFSAATHRADPTRIASPPPPFPPPSTASGSASAAPEIPSLKQRILRPLTVAGRLLLVAFVGSKAALETVRKGRATKQSTAYRRFAIRSIPVGCLLLMFGAGDFAFAVPAADFFDFIKASIGLERAAKLEFWVLIPATALFARLGLTMIQKYLAHCEAVGIAENPQPMYWVLIHANFGAWFTLFVWLISTG